jgi:hypothetical protein
MPVSLARAASGGPDRIRCDCEPSRDRQGAFRAGSIGRSHRPEPPARGCEKYTSQLSHFPAYPNNGGVFVSEPVEQKSNEEQNEAIPEELTEEQLEETAGGLPHNY